MIQKSKHANLQEQQFYFPRAVAEENKDELSWAQIVGFNLLDNRTGKIVGKIISVDDSTINFII